MSWEFPAKTFESATIESQKESSFFEISTDSVQNSTPFENQLENGIYPQEYVSCVKIYDGDKGTLKK